MTSVDYQRRSSRSSRSSSDGLPPGLLQALQQAQSQPEVLAGISDAFRAEMVERSRGNLRFFTKEAWPIIEPARALVGNWHIDAICDHLQALIKREIGFLVINIPPAHLKSILASVMTCPWAWIDEPHLRFLYASYAEALSVRDSVKCRRIIESPWYRMNFSQNGWALAGDANLKGRYENTKTGYRYSISVGGTGAGERGDFVFIDDPHNVTKALRDAQREKDVEWYREAMTMRLNDQTLGGICLIMQRLHEADLTGHILANEPDVVHLMLPAEFEPERKCYTRLGFEDPRTEEGDLLFPERFPKAAVERAKVRLGSLGASGQLQQNPAPRGGAIVKLDWFGRYKHAPKKNIVRTVQSWDTAMKDTELSAYSVCITAIQTKVRDQTAYYIVDVFRRRLEHPDLYREAKRLAKRWEPHAVLIEDKASGTSLIQHLRKESPFGIVPMEPEGDKVMRMETETPAIEAGLYFLPENGPDQPEWLEPFELELTRFPVSEFVDQVDAFSQLCRYLRERAGFFVV